MISNLTEIPLAQFKPLSFYRPRIGDFVVWHGWFSHYFGIVSAIKKDTQIVTITKAGLPHLLFTMTPEETSNPQNTVTTSLAAIMRTKSQFAFLQDNVWYF